MPEWAGFIEAARRAPIAGTALRILPAAGLHLDLSAQANSPQLLEAGQALLQARNLAAARAALFEGGCVNPTEGRAAWHTMLRARSPIPQVAHERARMLAFVRDADAAGRWRNVLHIGIGGSDWGNRLMSAAFGYGSTAREVRFVSNIDGHAFAQGIAGLDPADTLVTVTSKSFTTTETQENARRALEWLASAGIERPTERMVAITSRPDAAREFGIPDSQIFPIWDWVGGRFSLWSSVCMGTALAVGTQVVEDMLAGAAAMDEHFLQAPIAENAPVQMALAGIVNRNALGYATHNVAVYDSRLPCLVPYIQQLEMESLGKSTDVAGRPVGVATGPVVWGMPGTDAQHTFFQWLHQGTDGAPVDFIVCKQADHPWDDHHQQLLAHCLAQREALLRGKPYEDALAETRDDDAGRRQWLARHKVHPGGRPSSLIVLPRLTPAALGALIALYEHKVFVQALVWGINPFDQWGVEFGKKLAHGIRAGDAAAGARRDPSTAHWIREFAGKA
ncbi:glucose-6-phosphate isomerase [Bordetella sp. 2513F-2]